MVPLRPGFGQFLQLRIIGRKIDQKPNQLITPASTFVMEPLATDTKRSP